MARKKKRRAPTKSASPSTDAELARRVTTARRRAEVSRATADLAHKQSEEAHIGAEAAHLQAEAVHARVHSLEEEIHRHAASPEGIARAPKTGAKPPSKSEQRGAPLTAASFGAPPESKLPFSVVGIGASAGGYEAYTTFLANLPRETGMAYVLIQHLDPSHPSHLRELLGKVTQIPVVEIRNGTEVRPDRIYVLPPNATVTLESGRLKLSARPSTRGISTPVDIFFRSLAIEQQNRAIGIILSGSGTDGTLGMAEIKGEGGITFAQDQGTSKHFGMPGSAIGSGSVDFVMTPEQIAQELSRLSGHPYVAPKKGGQARRPVPQEGQNVESLLFTGNEELRTLFMLLRTRTGVDFSLYKPGTLNRRIMRRMALHKIDSVRNYIKLLHESPTEVDALFNDLLISVTGFFRDPGSFQALQKKILPRLIRGRGNDAPLRIWSCGCSTGEEAYSLAIAVSEFLEKEKKHLPLQVFASDLNERGIEKARAGVYHENILLDVSQDRLRRFFSKVDGFYQINKSIRDLCIFARQNVVLDPPFSNVDLISCRNVLIYLTPVLQKRVLPVFHYALKPHGFLLLGSSESMAASSELFEIADRKHKFYAKKLTAYRPRVEINEIVARQAPARPPKPPGTKEGAGLANLEEKVDHLILTRYSPAGVLINAQLDVLQFRGETGRFIEHQPGTASLNLLKMIREDLSLDVRQAVNRAIRSGEPVEHRATHIRLRRGVPSDVTVEVQPVTTPSDSERFFLVLFQEAPSAAAALPGRQKASSAAQKGAHSRELIKLRDELAATRESLQAIIEEQEATNEELKSANEEIQSSNEELQSTNEELETAREELQSTNEELTTLNQELQNRNSELNYLNNDLTNLLTTINIAVIILSQDLTIRRYTATAEKLFNFIPSDVGRRLSDITRTIHVPELEDIIHDVNENLAVVEREVQDREGRWYSLRVRPYRTQQNRIDGAVLMLLDIEEIKRAMIQMMGIVRHPLLLLHSDLTVSRANDAFYEVFKVSPKETENRNLYDLGNRQWNIPQLRELLEEILPNRTEVHDFLVEHEFPQIGYRKFMINARRFYGDDRGVERIVVAFEDVTDRA